MNLELLIKRLGLSTVGPALAELTPIAEREGWSYCQFLERLLCEEIAHRAESRIHLQA